jgi:hypothetical protein
MHMYLNPSAHSIMSTCCMCRSPLIQPMSRRLKLAQACRGKIESDSLRAVSKNILYAGRACIMWDALLCHAPATRSRFETSTIPRTPSFCGAGPPPLAVQDASSLDQRIRLRVDHRLHSRLRLRLRLPLRFCSGWDLPISMHRMCSHMCMLNHGPPQVRSHVLHSPRMCAASSGCCIRFLAGYRRLRRPV